MAPRKKVSTKIKPLSLNAVLSKQTSILDDLLECNRQLREVIKAFKPDKKQAAHATPNDEF